MEELETQVQEETQKTEITEMTDGGVEVTLDKQETPKEEVQEEAKTPDTTDDKLRNKLGYMERQIAKQTKLLESLQGQQAPEQPKVAPIATSDFEKMVQDGKVQEAVAIVAKQEARRVNEEYQTKIKEDADAREAATNLESNSQYALSRHSELNDTNSEKTQIWFDVLNKNPRWRNSPDGPLLTMYKMEEELRKRGYDVDGAYKKASEEEKDRLGRVTSTSVPASRVVNKNKIVLTKDQRDFCDTNGIKYEDYARNLARAGETSEVTV